MGYGNPPYDQANPYGGAGGMMGDPRAVDFDPYSDPAIEKALSTETMDALLGAPPADETPGIGGGAEGQDGQRRRKQLRFNRPVGSRLSNQDFNPAGYTPNQSRSTSVGKYGGSPLFAASIGVPFAVFDDQANAHAKRQAEIDKARQSFDPHKGLNDPEALKYRDSMNNAAMDNIDGYVDQILADYGDEEGTKLLMNPGSKPARELDRRVRHWNTVFANIDDSVKKATAVTTGMDTGALEMNPALYDDAKELEDRLGSWENQTDVEWLAENMPKFQAKVSLADYMKTNGIAEILAKAGTTNKVYESVSRTNPDGSKNELYHPAFATLVGKKTTDRTAIVDAMTDYLGRMYQNELTRDQVRAVIDGATPQLYEEDVKRNPIPGYGKGKGKGAAGGSGSFGKYQHSHITGPGAENVKHDQVRLGQESAGKGRGILPPVEMIVPQPDGTLGPATREHVHPVAVYEEPGGRLMIHGKVGKEPGAQVVTDEQGNQMVLIPNLITGEQKRVSVEQYFNTLRDINIPYKDNEGALETVVPGMDEQYFRRTIDEGRKRNGGNTQRQADAAPAKSEKSPYYDNKDEPPPAVINAKFDHKSGTWVTRSGDKWVKVRRSGLKKD